MRSGTKRRKNMKVQIAPKGWEEICSESGFKGNVEMERRESNNDGIEIERRV